MPERIPSFLGRTDHVSWMVVEKRSEVYSRVATLIMDLEEALLEDDVLRSRYLLQDVRRTLRGALAFLTDEVNHELQRLEDLSDRLPEGEQGFPRDVAEELKDRLQLLHVKLARVLKLDHLQDMERIVGLNARLKHRLEQESKELDTRSRRRVIEQQCWQLESEARELIGQKLYPKAVRSLKKAIRLDPERAVFHNDLGVVYSLLGKNEEAVAEYRTAVTLNEQLTERRTEEWTTSYYNLGIALRKAAQDAARRSDAGTETERLRAAIGALQEYTRLDATGRKVQDARQLIRAVSSQLRALEGQEATPRPLATRAPVGAQAVLREVVQAIPASRPPSQPAARTEEAETPAPAVEAPPAVERTGVSRPSLDAVVRAAQEAAAEQGEPAGEVEASLPQAELT